jgi:Arc/MetJ-type ribon-helix-helix transcriptional regulator
MLLIYTTSHLHGRLRPPRHGPAPRENRCDHLPPHLPGADLLVATTSGGVTGCRLGRHTQYDCRMTMLSFRVDDADASEAQRWAERLGVDRSELLREALRRHLDRLASEQDGERWEQRPLDEGALALAEVADWGPAEDWSDWADATG